MDIGTEELTAEVLYQLSALDGLARVAGDRVRYLKPHGALYHRVLDDEVQASAVVGAVVAAGAAWQQPIAVLTMAGGALAALATSAGLQVVAEAFADRAYDDVGRLVPRSAPNAVLTGDLVVAQAQRWASDPGVGSLCVHGDTPGAAEMAAAIRQALTVDGLAITAPWL
jgi:UPF0271 protein